MEKGNATLSYRFCGLSLRGILYVTTLLLFALAVPSTALLDDWYSYASFEDTSEWSRTYRYTCDYAYDLFQEPRELEQKDDLQSRKQLLTPVRFYSNKTVRSPENLTLHIYNYPALRNAYSVAYGFQRNKECIHGHDPECIVHPELGRVRALVINADRFEEGKNLNYIKDHFLIENPEHFLTILNGGSSFERKFYEAVFLGSVRNTDPTRSSHQIDGRTYPLEIYMYFLDETVPSVNLGTILVVLVEESDRDNYQIQPVVQAVEAELYDKERRFLDRNKAMIRRQRLYHHLKPSTYYDVFDTAGHQSSQENILMESLNKGVDSEAETARFVEPFEQMQGVLAQVFLVVEDYEQVNAAYNNRISYLKEGLWKRKGNDLVPTNFTEYQILMYMVDRAYYFAHKNWTLENQLDACDFAAVGAIDNQNFFQIPQFEPHIPTNAQIPTDQEHIDEFGLLASDICKHFVEKVMRLHFKNLGIDADSYKAIKNRVGDENRNWTPGEKLEIIRKFTHERKLREELNERVYKHFRNKTLHPYNPGDEKPDYANDYQESHIVDGLYEFILNIIKATSYNFRLLSLQQELQSIADKFHFDTFKDLFDIVIYLKSGNARKDMKNNRREIYNAFRTKQLQSQTSKRNFVELGGMEMSEELIDEDEKRNPVKVRIQQGFQISWLLPQNGGYYYYAGSSPVPPCFRTQNVIVFKKPIKMSRRQIDVLTRVPTSFDRNEDIRATTPKVHNTRFEVELSGADTKKSRIDEVRVQIFDQPRNHLFLGHDGFHKNSVEEWEKYKARKEKGSGATALSAKPKIIYIGLVALSFLKIKLCIY